MKKNVGLFSLILFMLILSSNFNNLEKLTSIDNFLVETSFKLSDMIPHEPIIINGNEDFASQALAEGWPGNGSQINPYLISGLNLTTDDWWDLSMNISNVDCYFLIVNSIIHRIYLNDVMNANISNNDIDVDIDLRYSSNCNISNNNIDGSLDLSYSNNISIGNNFIEGVFQLSFSFNNRFINNTLNFRGFGLMTPPAILVEYSHYNFFSNNSIPRAINLGIGLTYSLNNTVTHNILSSHISLFHSINNTINYNILSGYNDDWWFKSIDCYNSTNNNIVQNNLSQIRLTESSQNNIIKDNLLRNGLFISGETIESCIQTEVANNSIDNKSIFYWQNKVNETIPVGVGQIILINCSTISIYNQLDCGIYVIFSQQITIYNNFVNNTSSRIYLDHSFDCIIQENYILNSSERAIEIHDSFNCRINNNTFDSGISMMGASNCSIRNNRFKDNFYLDKSSNNVISDNIISNNTGDGISLFYSSNNNFSDNLISNNSGDGISLERSSNNNIIRNNLILENQGYGISLSDSSKNTIFLNSFINNNLDYPDRNSQASDNENAEIDNHFFANYWSDWTSPDVNHDNIVDLPYIIGSSPQINQDSYPLTTPPISLSRVLIPPQIIVPNGREIIKQSVTITWLPAFDTQELSVKYSVYYSVNSGTSWILLIDNLATFEFIWDVSTFPSGSFYLIKVLATFDDGATVMDISDEPFSILNPDTITSTTTSSQSSSFPSLSLVLFAGLVLCLRRKLYKRGK